MLDGVSRIDRPDTIGIFADRTWPSASGPGFLFFRHKRSFRFGPGQTAKTVAVTVRSDATAEADETFTFQLSGAVGASVTDPSGLGTIRDND